MKRTMSIRETEFCGLPIEIWPYILTPLPLCVGRFVIIAVCKTFRRLVIQHDLVSAWAKRREKEGPPDPKPVELGWTQYELWEQFDRISLANIHRSSDEDLFIHALVVNSLPLIQWAWYLADANIQSLASQKGRLTFLDQACILRRKEIVSWVVDNSPGRKIPRKIVSPIFRSGDILWIQWVDTIIFDWEAVNLRSVVQSGNLEAIKWVLLKHEDHQREHLGRQKQIYEHYKVAFLGALASDAGVDAGWKLLMWAKDNLHDWRSEALVGQAAYIGRVDIVEWLCENGCRFNPMLVAGQACKAGRTEVMEWFVKKGLMKNVLKGTELLGNAILWGRVDMVEFILREYDKHPELPTTQEQDLQANACQSGSVPMFHYLAKELSIASFEERFNDKIYSDDTTKNKRWLKQAVYHKKLELLNELKKINLVSSADFSFNVYKYGLHFGHEIVLRWAKTNVDPLDQEAKDTIYRFLQRKTIATDPTLIGEYLGFPNPDNLQIANVLQEEEDGYIGLAYI